MKRNKIFVMVILMICLLFSIETCFGNENNMYYNDSSNIFYTKPIVGTWFERLQVDITAAPYNVSDYQIHSFDCSNMCGLLHDWLEEKGWNVKIYIGERNGGSHAWLLVNGTWVEAIWKSLSYDRDYNNQFANIRSFDSPSVVRGCKFGEFEY